MSKNEPTVATNESNANVLPNMSRQLSITHIVGKEKMSHAAQ